MPNERVRGFVQLFGTNVVTKAAWALTLFLLLHKLGPQQFGVLATLWSISTIVAGGADLGTSQALLREGSRKPATARNLARQAGRLQIITSLLLGGLVSAVAWMALPTEIVSGRERALVIILSTFTPFIDRFQTLFTVFSQTGGNYSVYAWVRSAYFLTLLVAMSLVVYASGGLVMIAEVYFVLTLLFSILMSGATWRLLPQNGGQSEPLGQLLKNGIPFLAISILALAYGRVEVSILGSWNRLAAAGAYHVIYQLVLVAYSVSGIFFTIVYPRLYKHLSNTKALLSDFRDTARWLSLLAWLAVPPLLLYPAPILKLIGGTPMLPYVPLMRVLSLIILVAPASAGLNFLLPLDKLRTRIACDALGIVLTALVAVLAASSGHPLLAAIGAVGGYAANVTIAQWVLRMHLTGCTTALLGELAGAGWRAVLAAIASWLLPVPWWLGIVTFVTLYLALLVITRHAAVQRIRQWIAALPT